MHWAVYRQVDDWEPGFTHLNLRYWQTWWSKPHPLHAREAW